MTRAGGATTCAVCDASVPAGAPRLSALAHAVSGREAIVVCARPACRERVMRLLPFARCETCARPLPTARERIRGECEAVGCVAARRERARARDEAATRVVLGETAAAWRDRSAVGGLAPDETVDAVPIALVPSTDPRSFPMHVYPAMPPPAEPLPRDRRRAFRAHLRRVATEAAALPPGAADAERAEAAIPEAALVAPAAGDGVPLGVLLGAACAACGGRCCRFGGDAAYLTPVTMRGWLDANPGADAAAAVTTYAGHLPAASIRGSCVYHTPVGCALPRELRSATCNRYLCGGLREFREAYAERAASGRPVRRAFVAVIDRGVLVRGQLADASGLIPDTPAVR